MLASWHIFDHVTVLFRSFVSDGCWDLFWFVVMVFYLYIILSKMRRKVISLDLSARLSEEPDLLEKIQSG